VREFALLISNYFIFVILLSWLGAMQSSLWLHVFGFTPAPYLWLAVINYWTLYRSLTEAIIMNYLATFAFITMSGMPLNMAFAVNLSVFSLIFLMKDRVLWSGSNSFMLSCGISALSLPVFTFIWSHVLESRPVSQFYVFDMIIRSLLTAASSLPLYYLFVWMDRWTQRTVVKNRENEIV
jgi:hypothetical protein